MKMNAYLYFKGDCEAAFKFYAKCLNGTIEMMRTHADTPMRDSMSPEWRNKIVHARMTVGDQLLMGSDAPPEHYEQAGGFSVSLTMDDPSHADRIFNSLAENATVGMPLQKTFWALKFGTLVDQFGIPWIINCAEPY